jgi:hypothetical protein
MSKSTSNYNELINILDDNISIPLLNDPSSLQLDILKKVNIIDDHFMYNPYPSKFKKLDITIQMTLINLYLKVESMRYINDKIYDLTVKHFNKILIFSYMFYVLQILNLLIMLMSEIFLNNYFILYTLLFNLTSSISSWFLHNKSITKEYHGIAENDLIHIRIKIEEYMLESTGDFDRFIQDINDKIDNHIKIYNDILDVKTFNVPTEIKTQIIKTIENINFLLKHTINYKNNSVDLPFTT